MLKLFIGYDPRQPVALQVLMHSIYSRATQPVSITPLVLSQLPIKRRGLTEFTFTRYLVPYLCNYEGQAMFLDADMLVLGDICELFELASKNKDAVSVVKGKTRFEWPSLMFFNNAQCIKLTPWMIEHDNPQKLEWADSIGELPKEWNHIVGYDEPNQDAKLIHYTQGIPCFEETQDCEHGQVWRDEMRKTITTVSWDEIMGGSVHALKMKKPVSFIHYGDTTMASFRYRANNPAHAIGASLNDIKADIVIFAKPQARDIPIIAEIQQDGRKVIVDFCDDHFDVPYYHDVAAIADMITCPTAEMAKVIFNHGYMAKIIPDAAEYPLAEPHCNGANLLWYGHGSNIGSLTRILPDIKGYPLRVVSNVNETIPWSLQGMLDEFKLADIVLMPATKEYKSPNRTIEAIRQGCFVVAEPHPSINDIPGIWIGEIKAGIEWAVNHPQQANEGTKLAQEYVNENFSQERTANAWKQLVKELSSTSAAVTRTGTGG